MTPFWAEGAAIRVEARLGRPSTFDWEGRRHVIQRISRRWRVHTAWWTEGEAWREYWEAATDSGLLCAIYHDLRADTWHLERIYE